MVGFMAEYDPIQDLMDIAAAISSGRAAQDPNFRRDEAARRRFEETTGVSRERNPSLSVDAGEMQDFAQVFDREGERERASLDRAAGNIALKDTFSNLNEQGLRNLTESPILQSAAALDNAMGTLVRAESAFTRGESGEDIRGIFEEFVDDPVQVNQTYEMFLEEGLEPAEAGRRALATEMLFPGMPEFAFLATRPWGTAITRAASKGRVPPAYTEVLNEARDAYTRGVTGPQGVRTSLERVASGGPDELMEALRPLVGDDAALTATNELRLALSDGIDGPMAKRALAATEDPALRNQLFVIPTFEDEGFVLVQDGIAMSLSAGQDDILVDSLYNIAHDAAVGSTRSVKRPDGIQLFLDLADAYRTPLTTSAGAFGHMTQPTDQLKWMYNSIGFEPHDDIFRRGNLIREPFPIDDDVARKAEAEARMARFRRSTGDVSPNRQHILDQRRWSEEVANEQAANQQWTAFNDWVANNIENTPPSAALVRLTGNNSPFRHAFVGTEGSEAWEKLQSDMGRVLNTGMGEWSRPGGDPAVVTQALNDFMREHDDLVMTGRPAIVGGYRELTNTLRRYINTLFPDGGRAANPF